MFGQKKRTIEILTRDVDFWHARSVENLEASQKAGAAHKQTKAELAIIREAYVEQLAKIAEYERNLFEKDEKIARADAYADSRIQSLDGELAEARNINENLREEAAESSRMLELYKALVASLRIVIKLPASRKK
jgi:hypothetical protein